MEAIPSFRVNSSMVYNILVNTYELFVITYYILLVLYLFLTSYL